MGLNSAWLCRNSRVDRDRIAIGEYQIYQAVKELEKQGRADVNIFMFHHPLEFLRADDSKSCRNLIPDNSILLLGHMHDVTAAFVDDLNGKIYPFQAGAAYLSDKDKH